MLKLNQRRVSVEFFALVFEWISVKTHSVESRCYRTGKYSVCMSVRASFSPEINFVVNRLGNEGVNSLHTAGAHALELIPVRA